MTTQNKNVPALRFPEFNEDWRIKSFGEITTKVGSGSTPTGGAKVYLNSGVVFIRSQNVIENQLSLEDATFISEEVNSKMKGSIVKANDILLNITGGSIGRSCVVPNSFKIGNVNQHVCIIRLDAQNTPIFLQLFISSEKGQKLIFEGQTGSGREGLNFQSIRAFKINLPTLPEQQKIASFLTSVDEKIQQLTKKKELLEQYKKGVMQKIFNQEIRFKDDNGNDFADWEEKEFEEIYISLPTKQFQILTSEILENGQFKVIDQGQKKIAGFSNDFNKLFKDVPIIIFGDHTAILKYVDYDFIVGADGTKILKNKFGNLKFFYYCLVFNNIETEGYKRHYSILKSISLQFPESVDEQTKIANFLSSIDDKINQINEHLEKTKEYKKGLLQQMFV
jgi:type I restriction enzyme S subunit